MRVTGSAAVALPAWTIFIGVRVALVTAGWTAIIVVAGGWWLVRREGLRGGVCRLRGISRLGQLAVTLMENVRWAGRNSTKTRRDIHEGCSLLDYIAVGSKARMPVAGSTLGRKPCSAVTRGWDGSKNRSSEKEFSSQQIVSTERGMCRERTYTNDTGVIA